MAPATAAVATTDIQCQQRPASSSSSSSFVFLGTCVKAISKKNSSTGTFGHPPRRQWQTRIRRRRCCQRNDLGNSSGWVSVVDQLLQLLKELRPVFVVYVVAVAGVWGTHHQQQQQFSPILLLAEAFVVVLPSSSSSFNNPRRRRMLRLYPHHQRSGWSYSRRTAAYTTASRSTSRSRTSPSTPTLQPYAPLGMAAARDGQNQTILTDPTKPTATNWMRNNSSISISNTGTSPAVASSILPSLTDVTTSNGNNNSHDNSRNQTPKNINNNIRRRTMSTSVAWERGYFDSDSAQGNEFDDDYDDGPQELHDLPVAWERNISAASQISTTIKPRASSEKRYIPGYSPSSIPRTTTMTARPAQLPELKSKAPPKKQTFSKAPLASTPYYDLTTASSTKPSTTTTLSLPTKVDSAPLVVAAVSARKTTEASKAVPAAALSTDTVPATASVEPAMAAPPPNDAAPTASRAKTTAMANKKSTSKNEVDSIPSSSSVADSAQGPNGVAPTASRPKITSMANNAKTNEPKTEATANAMKAKDSNNNELLNPLSLLPVDEQSGLGKIPYPKALSPSSIKEFQACPQSFFFQYILGLKQPTTAVLAKGSMCHSALERLFDLDPGDRSLPVLQNLFRTVWSEHRLTDLYRPLFEEEPDGSGEGDSVVDSSTDTESSTVQEQQERVRDVQREVAWGRESLQLLDNYWRIENAAQVMRPNPVQREMWVRAPLSVQGPRLVADDTAALSDSTSSNDETFLVRGIIDRLDMVQDAANKTDVTLRLIDYKSGKAPDLKYSPSMNEKIQKEAFEQLLIYALLHRETGLNKKNSIPLRYLRLFYLTSVVPDEARFWDLDLGATSEERDALLNPVHTNIAAVWKAMCQMIDLQDPTVFTGCERSFCYCHKCRSRFIPGTVWEPQS